VIVRVPLLPPQHTRHVAVVVEVIHMAVLNLPIPALLPPYPTPKISYTKEKKLKSHSQTAAQHCKEHDQANQPAEKLQFVRSQEPLDLGQALGRGVFEHQLPVRQL
jgi:hypothetical protein